MQRCFFIPRTLASSTKAEEVSGKVYNGNREEVREMMVSGRVSIRVEARLTANQIISNHRPSSAHKKDKSRQIVHNSHQRNKSVVSPYEGANIVGVMYGLECRARSGRPGHKHDVQDAGNQKSKCSEE